MKKITIILLTTFSLGSYANLSNVQKTNIIPSSDTQAYRALIKASSVEGIANNALNKANSVEGIAQEANGIAKGTRATLVNKQGCVYNNNFDCTEANLTHQYTTKSWNTPGTYYWRVPTNITEIYATITGGQGGQGGPGKCSTRLQYSSQGARGASGGNSSILMLYNSDGGIGGSGAIDYESTYCSFRQVRAGNIGSMAQTKSVRISVVPHTNITIIVGYGGTGGRPSFGANWANSGSRGKNGNVTIQY